MAAEVKFDSKTVRECAENCRKYAEAMQQDFASGAVERIKACGISGDDTIVSELNRLASTIDEDLKGLFESLGSKSGTSIYTIMSDFADDIEESEKVMTASIEGGSSAIKQVSTEGRDEANAVMSKQVKKFKV